jgi:hypothetical protein
MPNTPQGTKHARSADNRRNIFLFLIAGIAIASATALIILNVSGPKTHKPSPEIAALAPKLDAIIKGGKYPDLHFTTEPSGNGVAVHGAVKTRALYEQLKAEVTAAAGNATIVWDVAFPQQ